MASAGFVLALTCGDCHPCRVDSRLSEVWSWTLRTQVLTKLDPKKMKLLNFLRNYYSYHLTLAEDPLASEVI